MGQAAYRAACVAFLIDYAASTSPPIKMQVYPGRPLSINPPTGFVDIIREDFTYTGPTLYQRRLQADVVVLHGLFDSKEAANQKDAFVDGFVEWAAIRYHQAGANTLIAVVATEDIPNFVPDWKPPEEQRVYYATRITLEGYAENNA